MFFSLLTKKNVKSASSVSPVALIYAQIHRNLKITQKMYESSRALRFCFLLRPSSPNSPVQIFFAYRKGTPSVTGVESARGNTSRNRTHSLQLNPPSATGSPLAIAAGVVLVIAAVLFLVFEHGHTPAAVTPVTAALDPYAASLPISNLAMSESANLAGGKVTYVDGHIANTGARTVTGITVQVLFRDSPTRSRRTRPSPSSSSALAIPTSTSSPSPPPPSSPATRTRLPADLRRRIPRLGRSLPRDPHPPRRHPVKPSAPTIYSVELTPSR